MLMTLITKIKNKKILLILPILFLVYIINTLHLVTSIYKLSNIENILRILISAFLVVLGMYILSVIVNLINRGKNAGILLFSILIIALFLIQAFANITINKIYSSINEISKNVITYSTSLVTLTENNINDIKSVSNYTIGMIDDENNIEGHVIAKEIIVGESLEKNNTIKTYDSFPELLSALYDKEVDLIFISSSYVTMFSNTRTDGANKFKNIKAETVVLKTKSKKIKKSETINTESIEKPFTILIMGVDSTLEDINSGSSFNGDALMLVTFNPNTFNATILSIPRDTYVPITCFKNKMENKITHAAWYGESCMMDTIENFTGINIDHYLKINFKGLVKLVDSLGGIDIDVPYSFCEQNSNREWGKNTVYVKKGYRKLNGEQALALTRNRHANPDQCSKEWTSYNSNDIIRGQNQQLVISGIVNGIKNIKNIDGITELLKVIQKNMNTSFSTNQILSFYNIGKKLLTSSPNDVILSMERLYLSGYDKYIYDKNMKLALYNYIYYKQSLKEIVNEMKINLEKDTPTFITEFYFSINEEYERKVIGKGYYNEASIATVPSFIGESSSYASSWGVKNNININIVNETTNIKDEDNIILKQSIPYAYLVSDVNKNTGITITVGKYVKSDNGTDEEKDVDCSKLENKEKDICQVPDFSTYTMAMAENWKSTLQVSIMVDINKITKLDSNYVVDNAGKLYNQSVTPGTDITTIKEITITYYDEDQ